MGQSESAQIITRESKPNEPNVERQAHLELTSEHFTRNHRQLAQAAQSARIHAGECESTEPDARGSGEVDKRDYIEDSTT